MKNTNPCPCLTRLLTKNSSSSWRSIFVNFSINRSLSAAFLILTPIFLRSILYWLILKTYIHLYSHVYVTLTSLRKFDFFHLKRQNYADIAIFNKVKLTSIHVAGSYFQRFPLLVLHELVEEVV